MRQIALALPPPRFVQEFEELPKDVVRFVFNDPGATNYGNQGAAQDGVDVFGRQDQRGRLIGVQCKRKGRNDAKVENLQVDLRSNNSHQKSSKPRPSVPRSITLS